MRAKAFVPIFVIPDLIQDSILSSLLSAGTRAPCDPRARVPAAAPVVPAAPPAEPREPYAVGKRYASLPGWCMKLIEGGVSYYYCGYGEWYRAAGKMFLAVAIPNPGSSPG